MVRRVASQPPFREPAFMSDHAIPHFHNQPGLPKIRIGARKFMCIGALPPFDHPHIYIDMGADDEAICPYCSTLYVFDASLHNWFGLAMAMRGQQISDFPLCNKSFNLSYAGHDL